jgi:hypothetical protein
MDDPEAKARIAAFQQGLEQLGWTDGRNVQIDTRWAGGDMESIRKHAAELVALSPDVILAAGGEPCRKSFSHNQDPNRSKAASNPAAQQAPD